MVWKCQICLCKHLLQVRHELGGLQAHHKKGAPDANPVSALATVDDLNVEDALAFPETTEGQVSHTDEWALTWVPEQMLNDQSMGRELRIRKLTGPCQVHLAALGGQAAALPGPRTWKSSALPWTGLGQRLGSAGGKVAS